MAVILFLVVAAAFDWKYREIPGWIYLLAGVEAVLWRGSCLTELQALWGEKQVRLLLHGNTEMVNLGEALGGAAIGAALLAAAKGTGSGIGTGDGLLFLVTGIYVGFWENLLLLCGSLLLCSGWGLARMFCRGIGWDRVKKETVPFLPFVVPVGLWLLMG